MRIGVVSDTHDHLANVGRIVDQFNAAGVAHVIHTGDITRPATLEAFAGLDAPLCGVYGNNDRARDALAATATRLGFEFVEPPLQVVWAERRIVVVHDRAEHGHADLHAGDVLLYGHDHRRNIDRRAGRLIFNPGECAGFLQGHNAVGVVDLEVLGAEILKF